MTAAQSAWVLAACTAACGVVATMSLVGANDGQVTPNKVAFGFIAGLGVTSVLWIVAWVVERRAGRTIGGEWSKRITVGSVLCLLGTGLTTLREVPHAPLQLTWQHRETSSETRWSTRGMKIPWPEAAEPPAAQPIYVRCRPAGDFCDGLQAFTADRARVSSIDVTHSGDPFCATPLVKWGRVEVDASLGFRTTTGGVFDSTTLDWHDDRSALAVGVVSCRDFNRQTGKEVGEALLALRP